MSFFLYFLYKFFTILITPFLPFYLKFRVRKGKEDASRYKEKLGFYTQVIPKGDLVWINCVSVGELNSIIELVNIISHKYPVLVTTSTLTSSVIFKERFASKSNVFHAFLPLDAPLYVKRFLTFFKPKYGIFIESEIWINLIYQASNICPIFSVNTRISQKTINRWKLVKPFFVSIMQKFKLVLPYSKELSLTLCKFGLKNIFYAGNLKYDFKSKEIIEEKVSKIKELFKADIILFASTHTGEEEEFMPIIKNIIDKQVSLIILPRHPERGEEIKKLLEQHNISSSLRSKDEKEGKVYIADTLGEVVYFYKLAKIIIMGGSFVDIGGHNILEPAFFKKAVIIGPYYYNFKEVVDDMRQNNSIVAINNIKELEEKTLELLTSHEKLTQMGQNAYNFLSQNAGVAQKIVNIIFKDFN